MRVLNSSDLNQVSGGKINVRRGYVSKVAAVDPVDVLSKTAGDFTTAACVKGTNGAVNATICGIAGDAVQSGINFIFEGPPATSPEAYATACAMAGGEACQEMQNAGTTSSIEK